VPFLLFPLDFARSGVFASETTHSALLEAVQDGKFIEWEAKMRCSAVLGAIRDGSGRYTHPLGIADEIDTG
jgi:hypothetical protein